MKVKGLILFGDSVLSGTGASDRVFGCGKLIKTHFSMMPVMINARNGDTSSDGLARLQKDVLSLEMYSHVVIQFGNNDAWLDEQNHAKVPLRIFENNLKQMLHAIKKNNQTPVALNLQPVHDIRFMESFSRYSKFINRAFITPSQWQRTYSDAIVEIAKAENIAFIDIREVVEDKLDQFIAQDGIHPNNEGHKVIAQKVVDFLIASTGFVANRFFLNSFNDGRSSR